MYMQSKFCVFCRMLVGHSITAVSCSANIVTSLNIVQARGFVFGIIV